MRHHELRTGLKTDTCSDIGNDRERKKTTEVRRPNPRGGRLSGEEPSSEKPPFDKSATSTGPCWLWRL